MKSKIGVNILSILIDLKDNIPRNIPKIIPIITAIIIDANVIIVLSQRSKKATYKKEIEAKIDREMSLSHTPIITKINITEIHGSGCINTLLPAVVSYLKPVANSPFKKIEGASNTDPKALVNSLNENIPKLASSINHLVIDEI
tara:strand:+ start:271 stop:702 length:432 start_codon:yes stop_codon:yes gene_type:complete